MYYIAVKQSSCRETPQKFFDWLRRQVFPVIRRNDMYQRDDGYELDKTRTILHLVEQRTQTCYRRLTEQQESLKNAWLAIGEFAGENAQR